jgi:hypothetical protein
MPDAHSHPCLALGHILSCRPLVKFISTHFLDQTPPFYNNKKRRQCRPLNGKKGFQNISTTVSRPLQNRDYLKAMRAGNKSIQSA